MSYSRRVHDDFKGLQPYGRRLTYALLLSLLFHALLLSLAFGGGDFWLPGLGFPWHERRIWNPDIEVALAPARTEETAPPATESLQPLKEKAISSPAAGGPFVAGMARSAPEPQPDRPRASPQTEIVPKAVTKSKVRRLPTPDVNPTTPASPKIERDRETETSPPVESATAAATAPPRVDQSDETASPPAVIAVAPTEERTSVAPATPTVIAPTIAEAPNAANPEPSGASLPDTGAAGPDPGGQEAQEQAANRAKLEVQRQLAQLEREREAVARLEAARADAARLDAQRQEAARVELARIEAARVEAGRVEAARVKAAKVEAAKVEAAKVEAAKVEAAKVEAARVVAAKAEAARAEAARAEAARAEAARAEAARAEAARAEAARAEAARAEAARAEAARAEAARAEAARAEAARAEAARAEAARAEAARAEAERAEAAARREERLRAIGRQLDEERARREAAEKLPPTYSGLRRYRLFGRADSNQEIVLYAEAWARKIQLNMPIETVREIASQPHTDPVVTVAMRSDGSVETIIFVRSSGVAAIDDSIRRIIESQRPYQAFPPNLAREYDVIEIRRTWRFDTAIRLE